MTLSSSDEEEYLADPLTIRTLITKTHDDTPNPPETWGLKVYVMKVDMDMLKNNDQVLCIGEDLQMMDKVTFRRDIPGLIGGRKFYDLHDKRIIEHLHAICKVEYGTDATIWRSSGLASIRVLEGQASIILTVLKVKTEMSRPGYYLFPHITRPITDLYLENNDVISFRFGRHHPLTLPRNLEVIIVKPELLMGG
jgi:hypothetical protein